MCSMSLVASEIQVKGFNRDVFELDPTNLQVPPVPVRGDDSIPRMTAPEVCLIAATIDDRIYALSSSERLYNLTHSLPAQSIF
ncbi:hypothetical protein MRB53_028009 [Persea americana]|uniref:Uncharacterized protein n=1 Tax=Persea americana TaxID=3435 RepID=A0ACC2KEU6_PERAE|nr:hypothetical protein MRB53_028009 [Persea americana]